MKKLNNSFLIFGLPVVLLWMKTYAVQKTQFKLPLENNIEEFILFMNPLSFIVLALGLAMLAPAKSKKTAVLVVSFLLSFVLYANVVFYRSFDDFITIPLLFQQENMSDLGSSIHELMKLSDLWMFLDVFIIFVVFLVMRGKQARWGLIFTPVMIIAATLLFFINLSMAETQRTQLLARAFDREMLVKYLGVYNYHVYDVVLQSKTKAQRSLAVQDDLEKAQTYIDTIQTPPNPNMTGIAKGKNIILISFESAQSFVINKRIDGEEITPFLNEMIRSNELFYFDNLYHQVGQGRTSDAEFIMDNSLYPLSRGAVFFTNPENDYMSMTELLKDKGYYTSVFHANNESFWNRNVVYKNFGTDKYYSAPSYDVTEENSVGWGLKDIEFFEQSIPYMKEIKEPFYAKMLMLTNHFPFTLKEEDKQIPDWTTSDGTVNRYFPTVRYSDEALRVFFDKLKESGLYDNSIVVIYGDHFGISENHDKAMGKVMGRKINEFERAQLQRVPLFIHIPGVEGKTIHKVAGQIDVRPTILNMLGVDQTGLIQYGSDLFAEEENPYAIFRDGSIIGQDYLYSQGVCFSKEYGLEVAGEKCEPLKRVSKQELEESDRVIYGDLLRFWKPKDEIDDGSEVIQETTTTPPTEGTHDAK